MKLYKYLIDKTILVVDDEEYNLLLMKDMLEDFEVNVVWARVGQEAIDIISSGSKIDLILMDMKMPFLDGFDTTKEIKKINSTIPVIAQTAFCMPEERERCFSCGCDAYISKPINFEELLSLANDIVKDSAVKI
jgi:two-component system cell cycle response regulator DivK